MDYVITALDSTQLDKVIKQAHLITDIVELRQAYFSPGSVSYCLLANGEPVLAGGIVTLKWYRGEAWMIPTPFFRNHIRDCYKRIKDMIPRMATEGKFRRIQVTCATSISPRFFHHLGFDYEGTMRRFGPNGESCYMYSRIF